MGHSIQSPNSSHRTMDFENENNSLKMDEEEDDEGFLPTGGNKATKFTLSLDYQPGLEHFKAVIIATSGNATAFGTQYLSGDSRAPIGTIKKDVETDSSDILLCCCSPTLFPEDFCLFSSTVLDVLPKDIHVSILTITSISDFKCDVHVNELNPPIVRVLTTTPFQDNINYIKLEQPNILSGISAGILTACDIRGIKAVTCIVYSSSMELDVTVVETFSNFLSVLQTTKRLKINGSRQFPVIDDRVKTGNLYM